jgi:hypothetical protein
MKLSLILILFIQASTLSAKDVDCTEAYSTPSQCEIVACLPKYKEFIGNWSGPFLAYDRELSTEEKTIFRPFQNKVSYSESDCLKNKENGDVFIIGRRVDQYPAFMDAPEKKVRGLLITGRTKEGTPFLRTIDNEGINNYEPVYQNSAANLSVWKLTVPASENSPEMEFTTIDGKDFNENLTHKRNVTVTMRVGPASKPLWEGVIAKGYHSLSKEK